MNDIKFASPINRLQHWAQVKPHEIYLTQPIADQVIDFTWSQVLHEVSSVAQYLLKYPPVVTLHLFH
jgi:hypothetical protein